MTIHDLTTSASELFAKWRLTPDEYLEGSAYDWFQIARHLYSAKGEGRVEEIYKRYLSAKDRGVSGLLELPEEDVRELLARGQGLAIRDRKILDALMKDDFEGMLGDLMDRAYGKAVVNVNSKTVTEHIQVVQLPEQRAVGGVLVDNNAGLLGDR